MYFALIECSTLQHYFSMYKTGFSSSFAGKAVSLTYKAVHGRSTCTTCTSDQNPQATDLFH